MLCQTLYIISQPSVNSNWSYNLETLNSGQNWWFFLSCVNLKFDTKTWKTTYLNYHPEETKLEPNHQFFGPCDLEIWQMSFKNNRAPFLYYFKLCASSESHLWIQTRVTVQKHSIEVKIGNFLSPVTLKFDRWPCKIIAHLLCATLSFVHHFVTISEFKQELRSRNAQTETKFILTCDLHIWPLTLIFCMDIISVNGNNYENFMMIQWQENCKTCVRRTDKTDGWTDRTLHKAAWSQLIMWVKEVPGVITFPSAYVLHSKFYKGI